MDALIHNKCELFLIKSFLRLQNYTEKFRIEVLVPQKGGFINEFIISTINPEIIDFLKMVFSAYLGYYFAEKTNQKANTEKNINNWKEIKKGIKDGTLTKEEVTILTANDKTLQKLASKFYKELEKEPRVKGLEILINTPYDNYSKPYLINRVDFPNHHYEIDEMNETTNNFINEATIKIISPVLQWNPDKKWYGIYHKKKISFSIIDYSFLERVYKKDVTFNAETKIVCSLCISEIINKSGRRKHVYTVDKVFRIIP